MKVLSQLRHSHLSRDRSMIVDEVVVARGSRLECAQFAFSRVAVDFVTAARTSRNFKPFSTIRPTRDGDWLVVTGWRWRPLSRR
jgi:hypothetical protein